MVKRALESRFSSLKIKGFTLLELLVALVIASLAISIVVPRFAALIPGVEIRGETQKVSALLRLARSRAIATGEVVVLARIKDPLALEMSNEDSLYTWPSSIDLEISGSQQTVDAAQEIAFYPNGSSSGGTVTLNSASRSYQLSVDWLSGRVTIDD